MSDPVSSIRNLGPDSDAAYARAGIDTATKLRGFGADAAYLKLLQSGKNPHFIGYYSMVMGLQGRPWNDCQGAEKQALRKRFDAIKADAQNKGRSDLEAAFDEILDRIGVIERRN